MIYGLVLVVHVLVALFLVAVILLQGGRGGLGEAMGGAAAQSLFGGGANTVMTKITAVVAGLFMATCLTLAVLSSGRPRSIIDRLPAATGELPLPPLPTQPSESAAPTEAAPASKNTPPAPPAPAAPASAATPTTSSAPAPSTP